MLAATRHRYILDSIDATGSVRTVDLAQQFDVTDETIRRDLEKLERENLVQRTHGGAIKVETRVRDRSFEERNIQRIGEKKRIGREAARRVNSGDRIFLDASSTALQMVPYLPDAGIVVMTNSSLVAAALQPRQEIELILTGGVFDRQTQSYTGPAAIATLRRFRIDKLFFSGNGIDEVRGISEINEAQAYIKEMMLPRAGTAIFLADPSKLGVTATYFFTRMEEIDLMITCKEADHPILPIMTEAGVEIHFAD